MSKLNKVNNNVHLQIENLDKSVLEYFNNQNPIYIYDSKGNEKKLNVIFNVGETWEQVAEYEKRQSRGDFILQKPIVTLKSTGLSPIKEWNRHPALKILLDKQIYKDENGNIGYDDKKKTPIIEFTYMRYPTHYLRTYQVSVWTDYIEDQNKILETILVNLISANMILLKNDKYNTVGFLRQLSDKSNFDNRSDDLRKLSNNIEFEFEGYIIDPKSIYKNYNINKITLTEEVVKEINK